MIYPHAKHGTSIDADDVLDAIVDYLIPFTRVVDDKTFDHVSGKWVNQKTTECTETLIEVVLADETTSIPYHAEVDICLGEHDHTAQIRLGRLAVRDGQMIARYEVN